MQNFGEYNMWLAAENGMFLRLTTGEWMTTMPENLNMEWVDSVKVCLGNIIFHMNFYVKLKLLIFVHDFSTFLSILRKEHLDHILSYVKHHLYGITSMQVSDNLYGSCLSSCYYLFYGAMFLVPLIVFFFFFLSLFSSLNTYIMSDIEFGRLQARDMLQHLWTGPISNASVDVVQGSRSVEVRAVGVTKVIAVSLVPRS